MFPKDWKGRHNAAILLQLSFCRCILQGVFAYKGTKCVLKSGTSAFCCVEILYVVNCLYTYFSEVNLISRSQCPCACPYVPMSVHKRNFLCM